MAARKNETISASFHYLARLHQQDGKAPKHIPFTAEEFDRLCERIIAKPAVDLNDATVADRVRYRLDVPMEKPRRDGRIMFGVYRGSYWGHAYDNSARGRIPADSISLRPFHYLLYLSEKGRLFIGSQYLGLFGGYQGLERTIREMLHEPENISAFSFRVSGAYYKDAKATELRVTFSNASSKSAGKPNITNTGMVAFKKQSKDDGFEAAMAAHILPHVGRPSSEVKRAVADLLSESDLLDVKDGDIEDCTVLATVNGRKKTTIHMIESGNFATRFPMDLQVNDDGHPAYDATLAAMTNILEEEIIKRGGHG